MDGPHSGRGLEHTWPHTPKEGMKKKNSRHLSCLRFSQLAFDCNSAHLAIFSWLVVVGWQWFLHHILDFHPGTKNHYNCPCFRAYIVFEIPIFFSALSTFKQFVWNKVQGACSIGETAHIKLLQCSRNMLVYSEQCHVLCEPWICRDLSIK